MSTMTETGKQPSHPILQLPDRVHPEARALGSVTGAKSGQLLQQSYLQQSYLQQIKLCVIKRYDRPINTYTDKPT